MGLRDAVHGVEKARPCSSEKMKEIRKAIDGAAKDLENKSQVIREPHCSRGSW